VAIVVPLKWLYSAWKSVPSEFRGGITPGGAIGRLFIPVWSVIWVFAVNARLATAIDLVLIQRGRSERAPREAARIAALLCFIPLILIFVLDMARYTFIAVAIERVIWTSSA
jgi:hypothetical protein